MQNGAPPLGALGVAPDAGELETHPMPRTIQTLDDLLRAIRAGEQALTTDLPTFGGTDPVDTRGLWSWDATRLLVGSCADDLQILTRGAYAERQSGRRLVLCRSDMGDGGWSLHAPGSSDEAIADGEPDADYLVSGPAEWTGADWSRPTQTDYDAAWQVYADRTL